MLLSGGIMCKYLNQCLDDAWDVIRGRKQIVHNKIVPIDDIIMSNKDYKEEYGWLSPDGTFYPVEFAKHRYWAAAYIKKMRKSGGITDTTMVPEKEPGDYLIRHGWVLLHNPHNYEFKVTADPTKSYTKSQIDFLYDYFMKHGMENKANELFLI